MRLPFGIEMRGGHHLGKVDHGDVIVVVEHEVELVEISVDEPVVGQLDDQFHDLIVQSRSIGHLPNLTSETRKQRDGETVNIVISILNVMFPIILTVRLCCKDCSSQIETNFKRIT